MRTTSSALSVFVCLSLLSGPVAAAEPPVEGPRPQPREKPTEPPTEPEVPPPNLAPVLVPDPSGPGIEFAIPPPEEAEELGPVREEPVYAQFPDPGVAPSDGVNMLVLSGTTIALTVVGFSAGLIIGLQRETPLEWLLPSTIVPTVGLLAFSGGGLYLGITRARAYRRWEIGNRVIGLPQGGGLLIGGSFALLGALGLIPAGAVMVGTEPEWGAALIAVGAASAIATPIMFALGVRNQRRYQQTGGWKRRPIPPLPAGASTSRLELRPMILPLPTGLSVGAAGRF
jgi:hypothetical protein